MSREKDTSSALTEVRTVLSRAETALLLLGKGPSEYKHVMKYDTKTWETERWPDPDQDDMEQALRTVVTLLSRWRRRKS